MDKPFGVSSWIQYHWLCLRVVTRLGWVRSLVATELLRSDKLKERVRVFEYFIEVRLDCHNLSCLVTATTVLLVSSVTSLITDITSGWTPLLQAAQLQLGDGGHVSP